MKTITTTYPFDYIAINLFSSLPSNEHGFSYIMVLVNMATCFTLLQVSNKSTLATAQVLYQFICDFGFNKITDLFNKKAPLISFAPEDFTCQLVPEMVLPSLLKKVYSPKPLSFPSSSLDSADPASKCYEVHFIMVLPIIVSIWSTGKATALEVTPGNLHVTSMITTLLTLLETYV
ncbi:hypothetical protein QOT17_009471 [Balamuthia mandrillaris]